MTLLQNYSALGALIFLAFGVLSFLTVYFAIGRSPRDDDSIIQKPGGERRGILLRLLAVVDLVGFPIVGYFIGPLVLPSFLG